MPRRNNRGNRRGANKRRRRMVRYKKLPPLGMPKKQLVRLKYADEIRLDPVAGGLATYNFSANGMYDPDVTALLNHQPLFFDEKMSAYNHFHVLGSKIKVTCIPTGNGQSSNQVPGAFGVNISDNTVFPYTSFAQIVESNQNKGKYRSYSNSMSGANTAGRAPSIIQKFSAKKMFANPLADTLKGSVATNPTEQAYFQIWSASVDSNDPSPTAFLVEVEYIALLTEPKFVAQS